MNPITIALGMLVLNVVILIVILAIKLPARKKGGTQSPNILQGGGYLHDLIHGFYAQITETKDLGEQILLSFDNGDKTRYFKKLLYGPTNNGEVMAGQPAVYIYGIEPDSLGKNIELRKEMERIQADYVLERVRNDEVRNREIQDIKDVAKKAAEKHEVVGSAK